ncbi:hypothetical protein ABK905_09345 [Acerihabitans sp. KWT182]|uniref:Uncharacterized protein n=1 Tax=Acerihabitans sp. KWT182 TaxID=3157919 RepID=A0AAU7QDZ6_9GAMM
MTTKEFHKFIFEQTTLILAASITSSKRATDDKRSASQVIDREFTEIFQSLSAKASNIGLDRD